MPKIKILPHEELCPNGAEIEATVGKSVCENLLNSSIEGFDSLNESTDDEEDLLDKAWGLEPKSRLSCQTIVDNNDLTIEIPKYTINMVSEIHPKKESKAPQMEKKLSKKDFSLSDSAISHISNLLEKNKSSGVRVSVKSSGCSGYAYDLSFVQKAEQDDFKASVEDIDLYIREESRIFLKGTEIDYVTKGLNSELIFNNPNISAKCGCGESFSIDQNLFQKA